MIYIISIALGLSFVVNILLYWYIREYLKSLAEVRTSILEFQKDVYDYNESLQSVLAMEIYHGEPTIEALVKNTQQVSESFDELGSVITNLLSGD
mgnify:FL=1